MCALRGALERDSQTPLFAVLNRRIAGYEIVGELARGGVGIVFKARQDGLQREVALKLLIAGQLADTRARLRFQQEAEAAAQLRHPHIVTVHEVGEHEGQPFIAMELVDGGTLADLAREQPLPARRAAELVTKLARAVDCAHQAGILHRDLKPSNILIDTFAEPRITDFGLAKVLTGDTRVTLTGQMLGSPSYMAPEQVTGNAKAIGPATDIYALGAILYQLVTTRPPFQGDSAHSVLRRVESEDPVPPRRLNPGVPVDLETVILKCLEKSPTRRYPTARELAAELDRFSKGQPVHARPVGAVERGWRWCCRRPRVAALGLTTLLLLGAVAVGSTMAAYRIKRSEQTAQHRLAESLVSQARAVRLAGRPGQRDDSLALLREARTIAGSTALRDKLRHEAIAALALPELRKTILTNLPPCDDLMVTCFDRDFSRCFLSAPDKSIRLYEVSGGRELLRLPFNTRQVDEVLGFDRSGRCVALRFGDQTCVWKVESNRVAIPTDGSKGPGEFSDNGKFFARGETNATLALYETDAGRCVARIPAGRVSGIAWSADDRLIAVTTDDGSVTTRRLADSSAVWQTRLSWSPRRLAWNQRRNLLATIAGSDRVVLLDSALGAVVTEIRIGSDESTGLAFSPDGELLAVSSEGGGIRLFDTDTGDAQLSDVAGSWHLQFSRDGRRLGGLWERGHVGWLDYDRSEVLRILRPPTPATGRPVLNISADNRWLVSSGRGELIVWDMPDGRTAARLEAEGVYEAKFGPDADLLVAGTQKGLRAWKRQERKWEPHDVNESSPGGRRYRGFVVTTDENEVVLADHGAGMVDWVDSTTLQIKRSIRSVDNVIGLALSPDRHWLYGGACRPHGSFLWDAERDTRVDKLPGDAGCQGAFSNDGKWLVTFGAGCSLWRVGDWERGPVLPLLANNTVEFSAAFHPDSRILAVTQHDHEIHLIDITSNSRQKTLEAPGDGRIHMLQFGPDGRTLIAARDRGEIQIWDLKQLHEHLRNLDLE